MSNMNAQPPEQLYRGISLPSSEVDTDVLGGIDLLPGSRVEGDDGQLTVKDGNEYGVYMSSDKAPMSSVVANPENVLRPMQEFTSAKFGSRMAPRVLEAPGTGIIYDIDPSQVINLRQPNLLDVYEENFGFRGQEWIGDSVPTEAYRVEELRISRDPIHRQVGRLVIPEGMAAPEIMEMHEAFVGQRLERLHEFGGALLALSEREREDLSVVDGLVQQIRLDGGLEANGREPRP